MLAKKYRLPVQDLRTKTGKTIKSRYFLLKLFTAEESYSRVGVVISRKVDHKATARNKLKRIVFDYFAKNLNKMSLNDYLVILLPLAAKITKEELIEEFNKYVSNL